LREGKGKKRDPTATMTRRPFFFILSCLPFPPKREERTGKKKKEKKGGGKERGKGGESSFIFTFTFIVDPTYPYRRIELRRGGRGGTRGLRKKRKKREKKKGRRRQECGENRYP